MNIKTYIPVTSRELVTGGFCLIFFVGIVAGSRLSRLTNTQSIESTKSVDIYLYEKTDLKALSEVLADSGLIESREELIWAGNLLGWKRFTKGHYQVDGGYSYNVFLSRLARGIQDPVNMTILPGRYEEDLFRNIATNFEFDSTQISRLVSDSAFLEQVELDYRRLVGRMLPNTYSMYWTTSPEAVIKRVLREFELKVLEQHRERFESIDKSVDEIITLASIIEWEANIESEKSKISGLYWNRLNSGMRLQADPTVNFAVGERRRLLYADYQIEHPYNTYLYRGLPPGPITNPSLSSIEAALYPDDHDYLYMVASPEGYHVFSETFEEHKEQSARWRDWLREQYRIKRRKEQESDDVSSLNPR